MSMDRSLKSKGALARHRNVLTRPERIEKLKEIGKWTEETAPFGLPKIAHRKPSIGKKGKSAKADAAKEDGK